MFIYFNISNIDSTINANYCKFTESSILVLWHTLQHNFVNYVQFARNTELRTWSLNTTKIQSRKINTMKGQINNFHSQKGQRNT